MLRAVRVTGPHQQQQFCAAQGFTALDQESVARQAPDAQWLVRDGTGVVRGRCSVWWSATPPYAEPLGLIGHYGALDDKAAADVLSLAAEELRARGCRLAVGPIDGNTWQNYRLVTERGEEPPFFLEPDNPDDWPAHFADSGFAALASYYSALNDKLEETDPGAPEIGTRLRAEGIRLRPLALDNLDAELRRIHALTLESFADSFLFTPIGLDDFVAQYQGLRRYVRPELVLLAEQGDGIVGYVFALPDLLRARTGAPSDTFIIKTLAVHPSLRGSGLGRVLAARCHEAARNLGYGRAIHALMQESSRARTISSPIARNIRRYALFAKPLR